LATRSGDAQRGDRRRAQQEDWALPQIRIVDDGKKEALEYFTIELSSPTGGAILGPNRSATVTLYDNE
jgi:hypothetical protein